MSKNVLLRVAATLASLLLSSIGSAEDAPQLHKGPWPIRNGRNYQPTENELKALHLKDVTPDEARKIDRLYDQLLVHGSTRIRHRTIPYPIRTVPPSPNPNYNPWADMHQE